MLKIVLGKNGDSEVDEGTFRIHYNDTQVILTSKRCRTCTKFNPEACAKCLLSNYNPTEDVSISNLRFFNSIYRGIHIEIELKFKEDVVR